MNFETELQAMRLAYIKKPLFAIDLPRPRWMKETDELARIMVDRYALLKSGKIYYGCIVQANSLLFSRTNKYDCPAMMVYSTDPAFAADPISLLRLAGQLFSLKGRDPETVPEPLREIARVITDEYDRSNFALGFPMPDGHTADIFVVTMTVWRKYLPCKYLRGSVMPILAAPELCQSVLILPKQYWSREFTKAWKKKLL